MKKFVAELVGTFMLVFIGTGAVVFGNGVEGLGHLLSNSGMSTASLGENALVNGVTVFGGFLFEVIATFLFVLVIMTVTSASKGNGAISGLVIGLSLMAMILVGLNITGLSVNPARSLAPAVLVGWRSSSTSLDLHPCTNRWWPSCSTCCEKLPWNRRIIEIQKALLLILRNRAFSYLFSGCQFSLGRGHVGRGVVLPSLHTWFQAYRSCSKGRLKYHRAE